MGVVGKLRQTVGEEETFEEAAPEPPAAQSGEEITSSSGIDPSLDADLNDSASEAAAVKIQSRF